MNSSMNIGHLNNKNFIDDSFIDYNKPRNSVNELDQINNLEVEVIKLCYKNADKYDQIYYIPDSKIEQCYGHKNFKEIEDNSELSNIHGINQGALGSCYLDAALTGFAAVSENYGPSIPKLLSKSDLQEIGINPKTNIPHYLVPFFNPDGKKIAIIV